MKSPVTKECLVEKRKERKKITAEDFTPAWLVNQMLDKLPKSTWEPGKTFCDPACGNGNMLIEVLKRKLKCGHNPFDALASLYGTDIMHDNVRECRLRLLVIISTHTKITREMVKITFNNIVNTSLTKYPNGSLDYDFAFNGDDMRGVDNWFSKITKNNNWIEEIL